MPHPGRQAVGPPDPRRLGGEHLLLLTRRQALPPVADRLGLLARGSRGQRAALPVDLGVSGRDVPGLVPQGLDEVGRAGEADLGAPPADLLADRVVEPGPRALGVDEARVLPVHLARRAHRLLERVGTALQGTREGVRLG